MKVQIIVFVSFIMTTITMGQWQAAIRELFHPIILSLGTIFAVKQVDKPRTWYLSGDPNKPFDHKAFLEHYGEGNRWKRRNKKQEKYLEEIKKAEEKKEMLDDIERTKDNIKLLEDNDQAFKVDKKTLGVYKTSFVIDDLETYILNTQFNNDVQFY